MPTIRISDKTLADLQKVQGPRETYDHVIQVLLATYEAVSQISTTIGPAHYLREKPKVNADAVRRDLDARTIGR